MSWWVSGYLPSVLFARAHVKVLSFQMTGKKSWIKRRIGRLFSLLEEFSKFLVDVFHDFFAVC